MQEQVYGVHRAMFQVVHSELTYSSLYIAFLHESIRFLMALGIGGVEQNPDIPLLFTLTGQKMQTSTTAGLQVYCYLV